MDLCRHAWRPGRSFPWRWLLGLAWLSTGTPGLAAPCAQAPLMLVHPTLAAPYDTVIAQLAAGLAEASDEPLALCALTQLPTQATPAQVVAVGEAAYAASVRAFGHARVLPILVRDLPAGAPVGITRFIAPALVMSQLRALSPASETLLFVHRREVPDAFLQRAQQAAQAQGLRWTAIAVGGLREAALAIERIRTEADATTAVWFHRDVLALAPDILLPPLVRASWSRGIAVVSDDAETVERGLLFALAPDYRALGRAAAAALAPGQTGLADIQGVRRVLNRRTAQAIGLGSPSPPEQRDDVVYE